MAAPETSSANEAAAAPARMRLDQALVARGLVVSRARARDLILRGEVAVDGEVAGKPAALVGPEAALSLLNGPADYVSRGALKLARALEAFGLEAQGRLCLDIGASTGGFTETLLQAGARRVYAIENGRGQLHPRLSADPRLVSHEGVDARKLTRALVPEPVEAIVADVSFISLSKALPAALALAATGCWLVALVKPQFEAGPGAVSKTGVVRDPSHRAAAAASVRGWLEALPGWQVEGVIESPVEGGDGNTEYLIAARYQGGVAG